ncbi:50S ribosomal protein L18 [Candidatus Daviesbacteria bacterium]|nr:50S ribosomal protein L18 [Candidatus Daviesbacteria bacterium]
MLKSKRLSIHKKIRKNIYGTNSRPRLSVFKSGQHIYAQIIDDSKSKTLVSASDIKIKEGTKKEKASKTGESLAIKATKKNIKQVVFDRGGFKYHGRISALAEGARKGGLEF